MMTAIAVGALVIIAYTYAGYPLIMAGLASLLPSRVRRLDGRRPRLSVCIAVHDGAAYIARKLESLLALDYPKDKLEIVVYSDGSSDQTAQIVERYSRVDPRVRLIAGARRMGKPTALNRLREAASGEVLIMTDVRQPLARDAASALVDALSDPDVGCVSGNLVLEGATGAGAYWRYEKRIRSAESALGRMVGVSGSIYAIRRADIPEIPSDTILDDMWIPLHVAVGQKKRIVLADRARAFESALEDAEEFPRKVRTLAGNYQLFYQMPGLLLPFVNPTWFELVSHKLMRLICPWAMLALFVASAFGAAGFGVSSPIEADLLRALVVGELGFYTLALLGRRAGRLGTLCRTFVVLNAAAVVGLWRFARGEQRVTW